MAAGAAGAAAGPTWVGEALNGGGAWTLRSRIPYILGFIMLFDSWDSVVIAYTLPSIIREWNLSAIASGFLISAGYGGQFIGAIVCGALAERRGRLPVLRWLVLAMGVLAIVCSMAGSYEQLVAFRLIQGLAIGGALPVSVCYVNELAPTASRGKYFVTFQFITMSGYGVAAITSAWIVPEYGWRLMFALGAIPLLFLPLMFYMPESPRWLATRGRNREAAYSLEKLGGVAPTLSIEQEAGTAPDARVSARELVAPGMRRQTGIAALLWFLTSLVSFGLVTWVPSIYVEIFDIPVADALSYNAVAAICIFFLPIVLRQTIDHVGRRPPAIIGTGIGGLALLAMLVAPSEEWVLVVGLLIVGQLGISVSSLILWPYTAEIFTTRVRSVALGTSSSLARAASMLTPLLVGGVLEVTGSVTLVFLIFGLASLVVALLWLLGTRETAGREMGL